MGDSPLDPVPFTYWGVHFLDVLTFPKTCAGDRLATSGEQER